MSHHHHKDKKHHHHADSENTKPEEDVQPDQCCGAVAGTELERMQKELAEYKDKYLRVLAESENTRKRLQKEKQEMIQFAQQNIIADFLNPIDHMENALKFTQQMSEEVKNWATGFQMILTQFKDVLTNNGVTAFPSEGKPFDPHRHEAVEALQTDKYPPGTVVEECLKGYSMGERTIRPARVKVSKATMQSAQEPTAQNAEVQSNGETIQEGK